MQSTGQAETVAMSNALRRAMHVKYVGEEMGISMPKVITIYVDATVALSFAADVGPPTTMKFVDLRESWVRDIKDKGKCRVLKIDGKINPSDFGTKILDRVEFTRQRDFFLFTPNQTRAKPKDAGMNLAMLIDNCDPGQPLGQWAICQGLYGSEV